MVSWISFRVAHNFYERNCLAKIDVKFVSRLAHFVPLKLLQHLASLSSTPSEIDYLNDDMLEAIKGMTLLNRGRLSVQPVSDLAFDAIKLLGDKGGWDELLDRAKTNGRTTKTPRIKKGEDDKDDNEDREDKEEEGDKEHENVKKGARKRKANRDVKSEEAVGRPKRGKR
jgi:hypothetical protein